MTEKYRISIFGSADARVSSLMADSGATREESGTTWLSRAESLQELLEELRGLEVDFRVVPVSEVGDRPEDVAGYLALFREDETRAFGPGPLLTYDVPQIHLPLANQEAIDIIGRFSPEVVWEPTGIPELFRLAHAPALPDPLKVKVLHGKEQGSTGYWLLMTDGQNYLTERNLEFLRKSGMVQCGLTEHAGTAYPTLPVPIYSGRVIDALTEGGVRFDAPPLYLRKE